MKSSGTPDRYESAAVDGLVVERRGFGPAVLFIHGIGGRWPMVGPVLGRIAAAGYEVVAIDLPRFGASRAQPSLVPSPREYAEWLTAWLVAEGIAGPHVVGNSMGGSIALELGRSGVASGVTAFSPIGFYRRPSLHYLRGCRCAPTWQRIRRSSARPRGRAPGGTSRSAWPRGRPAGQGDTGCRPSRCRCPRWSRVVPSGQGQFRRLRVG